MEKTLLEQMIKDYLIERNLIKNNKEISKVSNLVVDGNKNAYFVNANDGWVGLIYLEDILIWMYEKIKK